MIVMENIHKKFETGFALKDINLTITRGEKISIFGPNGAGKTTFLRILSCLIKPSKGSFNILGYKHTERIQILKNLGYAAPAGHFYEALTVHQNLEFFGKMYGLDPKNLQPRINKLLEEFHLVDKTNQQVARLSKGMKQRLMIIKTLLHDPKILLLDEPFSGLDIDSAEILNNLLNSFRDKTIITATHDFDTGVFNKQRVIIFNQGEIIFDDLWLDDSLSFKEYYKRAVSQ